MSAMTQAKISHCNEDRSQLGFFRERERFRETLLPSCDTKRKPCVVVDGTYQIAVKNVEIIMFEMNVLIFG